MSSSPVRGGVLAFGVAVLLHLTLFAAVGPAAARRKTSGLEPPLTVYMQPAEDDGSGRRQHDVRMINSPVVFSLPTTHGFSQELLNHDVQSSKMFMQRQVHSEQFLEVAPLVSPGGSRFDPAAVMIYSTERPLALPVDASLAEKAFPTARRVTLSPGLRGRLVGGVVLPSVLNQPVAQPWQVHASVSVSELGVVEHVFVDEPLESEVLNEQVLRLVYGLRFKPGAAMDGSVEIYAPESGAGGEGTP